MPKSALGIVKCNIVRVDPVIVAELSKFGVATLHEVMGRAGLMHHRIRPIITGASICGTAVTVVLHPGDNLMLHVAAEQIRSGDVVVAGISSECSDGFFGELLATSYKARGALGLVIDGGVRDVKALRGMPFPVWSRAVCAQGTVKAKLGAVNVPVICADALVKPGDVIVADEDGVVVIPATQASVVAEGAAKRETYEEQKRQQYASGALGLDLNCMREPLAAAGLRYVD